MGQTSYDEAARAGVAKKNDVGAAASERGESGVGCGFFVRVS